jgi:hypothetical protein
LAGDFCVISADFARLAEGVFGIALVAGITAFNPS